MHRPTRAHQHATPGALVDERASVRRGRAALAERSIREDGSAPEVRIAALFRRATARPAEPDELDELIAAYQDFLDEYKGDTEAALKLITIGETKPDATLDPADLAATTMVANIVLNLDEVITKE